MNAKFNLSNSLTLVLLVISLITLGGCQDRIALLVKDSNTSIAIERTGLDGEYDPSGLAKRVAKALAEDSALGRISTVYVAQNDSNIILKGKVTNQTLIDRLVTVAQNVSGVGKVDVSQVEIR
ncbi:MAG: BON domain-containing protein [Cyanobacteria bacterium P01_G01_bin.19]